jgi:hypothetical protein
MSNIKIQFYLVFQLLFIILSIDNAYTIDRIVLVGDSILDNAYWNGVANNTTGQCLVKILNSIDSIQYKNGAYVLIDDRSVEEATASAIVKALEGEGDGKINIPNKDNTFFESYIERRKKNGVAYDSTEDNSARLPQYCNIDNEKNIAQVNIKSDIKDSYVFISVGGNDLLLNYEYPFTIINNIKKIGTLYKSLEAKKVIYIVPYTMTNKAGLLTCYAINKCRSIFKWIYLNKLKTEYYDDLIDLSYFDESHRKSHYIIPEPTITGAAEIANLIINAYKINSQVSK